MKIALYSVSYAGIWYDGPALTFEDLVRQAKTYGYHGVELDGKRPHGNPMDLDHATRQQMREFVEQEGLEIPCVAANNDFSSPIPEHRECQLLMVREQVRLAADLGAGVVRLFAAWPGVAMHEGHATYDFARGNFYTFERPFPYVTRLDRWNFVKEGLAEAATFGEEFGVVLALQNHGPLIRHWKDCYDLVKEVNSPWLKMCLDLPIMTNYDLAWVREAAVTTGDLQVYSHFGGEFYRDPDGGVQLKQLGFNRSLPDYAHFLQLMREIGFDGTISFELCHPVLDDAHQRLGLDYVHEQIQLAQEFMSELIKENLVIIDPHNVLKSSGDVMALPGSAEELIADMNRANVDLAGAYCYDNAVTVEAVGKHPDRIFGMTWIVPSDEGALQMLERSLRDWKFKGLKLNMPKSLAAFRPNSVMNEIFDLLIQYDAVLLAHSTEGDHIFSMPYQFEQVARAFPRLKIILAHIGAPDDVEEAIRVATWNANVFLSSHAAPGPVIRLAAERAGAHKVLLGADWPYENFEVEIKKIKTALPNAGDRRLVLGENAQRLFAFEQQRKTA